MENRHQLKSLNFFFFGIRWTFTSPSPSSTSRLYLDLKFYADCHMTKAYMGNVQNASKLKHQQRCFSSLGVITPENKGSEGRRFLLDHYFDAFVRSRSAESPFPGLISIHK